MNAIGMLDMEAYYASGLGAQEYLDRHVFNRPPLFVGIDPGVSGAIAGIDAEGSVKVLEDMPTSPKLVGKGNQTNAHGLVAIVKAIKGEWNPVIVIEDVHSMPRDGVASAFGFGMSAGVIRGVAAASGSVFHYVLPHVWKKKYGLQNKEKDASRTLAMQMFPGAVDKLQRKKDNGRSDALLLAHFCLVTYGTLEGLR